MNTSELYDKIWVDIRDEDLEPIPTGWVSEDEKYRFEGEWRLTNHTKYVRM